jgi:imidazolonepropionase-like amidohydrolase
VRETVKDGNDLVKLKSSGGVEILLGAPDPRLSDDELKAMVNMAHELGVKVAAHAISIGSIKASLRAGVDSIEHGSQIDTEVIALFKKSGAFLVPTLEAPHDWAANAPTSGRNVNRETAERIWNETKASIALAYRSGVKIAFGTDIGFSPVAEEPEEFLYMAEVGMTPMDEIKAATVNAAALMGWSQLVGSVEPGKWADIVATDLSPLEDIKQLLHVSFVMKGGVIHKSDAAQPVTP